MKVFAFTAEGMAAVRRWHLDARQGAASTADLTAISEDAGLLRRIGEASDALVPTEAPDSRYSAAVHLEAVLRPLVDAGDLRPASDDEFWTWLAARWAEFLVKPNGKVGAVERWVCQLSDSRRNYRHLLAAPYLLHAAHIDRPERVRFLLANPLHTPGELAGQVGATAALVASAAALDVASALYWDARTREVRPDVRSKGAGSARRLAQVMSQFARTYSLPDLEGDGLAALLPEEFPISGAAASS